MFLGWGHFSVPETGTVLAPSSGHFGPRYGDRSEYQKREPLLVPKTGTASGSQNGNRFWFPKRGPLLVPRAGAALGTRPGAAVLPQSGCPNTAVARPCLGTVLRPQNENRFWFLEWERFLVLILGTRLRHHFGYRKWSRVCAGWFYFWGPRRSP